MEGIEKGISKRLMMTLMELLTILNWNWFLIPIPTLKYIVKTICEVQICFKNEDNNSCYLTIKWSVKFGDNFVKKMLLKS